MKFNSCLNAIPFLLLMNTSFAQNLPEINRCLVGIHGNHFSAEGDYLSILLTGNKLGGSLLVSTDKGVQVVQGIFDEKSQQLKFNFIPSGRKTKISQSYNVHSNNFLEERWITEDIKEDISPVRKVTGKEAFTLAGIKSMEIAEDRLKNAKVFVETLDEVVKKKIGVSRSETVKKREESFSQELKNLESCGSVADKNIQKAAQSERERLEVLQRKLVQLASSSQNKKNEKPAKSAVQ